MLTPVCLPARAELVDLVPDLTDDLLNTVDQPLQVAKDSQKNVYLLCDYNRDGDSYRSPWTNTYDPQIDDGVLPPKKLRAMEVQANELFASYMEQYYENGASSVYFWELDETAFAACVLFKKDVEQKKKGLESGGWDAIHVVEVRAQEAHCTPRARARHTPAAGDGAARWLHVERARARARTHTHTHTHTCARARARRVRRGRRVERCGAAEDLLSVLRATPELCIHSPWRTDGAHLHNARPSTQRAALHTRGPQRAALSSPSSDPCALPRSLALSRVPHPAADDAARVRSRARRSVCPVRCAQMGSARHTS